MRVIDLIRGEKPCLSFEVFPPKTSANYQSIQEATEKIAALGPDFISVTYGAEEEPAIIRFRSPLICRKNTMCPFWHT